MLRIFWLRMDINVSIILVSQSDRLTKVRGSLSTFQQRYWLYSLGGRGGEVEENPQAALAGTMAETEEALNGSAAVEFSERENPGVLLKTLRTNIDNPEQGAIPWQSVIKTVKPLAEQYCSCFAENEKEYFLQK